MKPIAAAIVVAAIAGFGALFYMSVKHDSDLANNKDAAGRAACPDPHWHNGFDVYTQQGNGAPQKVNFRMQYPNTQFYYYEWQTPSQYRAGGMRIAAHAHMSGAEGSGTTNQLHMEQPGVCVPLADAIAALDVHLQSSGLRLSGGHAFATGSDRTFINNATHRLHIWTQDLEGTWTERDLAYAQSTQVKDGESFLVAWGSFTDAQVKQMQDDVQPALSHADRLAMLHKSQGSTGSTSATGTSSHA